MSSASRAPLRGVPLGRIPYQEAWDLQRRLARARARDEVPDLLLFCEHEEVVTTGRRAQTPDRDPEGETAGVVAAGIPVLAIERGGAATYHGPGQLVGYPIVQLREGERDLHLFLRHIEDALIETVGALTSLTPGRREGLTGVWASEKKIASIGIACRRWVTYHGFALNLTTDLTRFALFNPCDLDALVMGSLASLGAETAREAVRERVLSAFATRLGRASEWGELPALGGG